MFQATSPETEPALEALKTSSILVQATASYAAAAPKFLRPTSAIGRCDGQPFILHSILDAMTQHPILVERPIVRASRGTVLARPVEKIETVL
jgi:arsenate reductase-like glutaredoxin family protein